MRAELPGVLVHVADVDAQMLRDDLRRHPRRALEVPRLEPAGDRVGEQALEKLRRALRQFHAHQGVEVEVALDAYSAVDQAGILIAEIVNAALPHQQLVASALLEQHEDGHDVRLAGTRPAFFFGPKIETLVGFAHHMLALTVANSIPVRVCEGCSIVFVPDPPNQRYHDPPCSNRARQKRHRAAA